MKKLRTLLILASCISPAGSSLASDLDTIYKMTVISTSKQTPPKEFTQPSTKEKLAVLAKENKYELITVKERIYLVSNDVLPNLERLQLQRDLIDNVIQAMGADGTAILDMAKLSPNAREAVKQTLQLFDPTYASQVDLSRAKLMVQGQTRIQLKNKAKSIDLTIGSPGNEEKNESIIQTIDSSKPATQPDKPGPLSLVVLGQAGYAVTYSLWMSDAQERLEALTEISKVIAERHKKETKPLKEAYANLMAAMRSQTPMIPSSPDGAFDGLSDAQKTDVRSHMQGDLATWGFANLGEFNSFLAGAQFSVSTPSLTLVFMMRDSKTGQLSGHSIPFQINKNL